MNKKLIDKAFYEAILQFPDSEEAQEYYYRTMDTPTGAVAADGRPLTLREQILRVYAMLFCDDMELPPGQIAGVDEVAATADRLYVGDTGFDPQHWYRMMHHFPVIDDDNYDRFAALVIADMNVGPLRDAAVNGGDVLLVGDADPLHMTREAREHQQVRKMDIAAEGDLL